MRKLPIPSNSDFSVNVLCPKESRLPTLRPGSSVFVFRGVHHSRLKFNSSFKDHRLNQTLQKRKNFLKSTECKRMRTSDVLRSLFTVL